MITFILAFIFIALMIVGMALGVIVKGRPLKGSCGGMSSLGMEKACDICGGDTKKCDEENQQGKKNAEMKKELLAYDAASKK
ncbi:MAG: (Na+)-NQR maturation NqrM [Marinagarivorans sp.]|nr:(Na+)-NQR maturation NqrM [Marinagarivorans sp.]